MEAALGLRELERDGIVTRTVFNQVPPKEVDDVAPDERERLQAVLDAICSWGMDWCDRTGARVLALEAS